MWIKLAPARTAAPAATARRRPGAGAGHAPAALLAVWCSAGTLALLERAAHPARRDDRARGAPRVAAGLPPAEGERVRYVTAPAPPPAPSARAADQGAPSGPRTPSRRSLGAEPERPARPPRPAPPPPVLVADAGAYAAAPAPSPGAGDGRTGPPPLPAPAGAPGAPDPRDPRGGPGAAGRPAPEAPRPDSTLAAAASAGAGAAAAAEAGDAAARGLALERFAYARPAGALPALTAGRADGVRLPLPVALGAALGGGPSDARRARDARVHAATLAVLARLEARAKPRAP